jgi:hypothetical protein
VSNYHDELQRRLDGDAPISEIAEWYIHCLAAEPRIMDQGLTDLEQAFIRDLAKDYGRWKKTGRGRH